MKRLREPLKRVRELLVSQAFNNAYSSIFSILVGLLFGFIILLIRQPWRGCGRIRYYPEGAASVPAQKEWGRCCTLRRR